MPARILLALVSVLVLEALLAGPAAAAAGDVVTGGILVLRIRTEAGGLSAAERAVIVEQRITEALGQERFLPSAVAVRAVNGQPAIYIGRILIVTADLNHARLNGTTPWLLAELWAGNLRTALPRAVPLGGPNV